MANKLHHYDFAFKTYRRYCCILVFH